MTNDLIRAGDVYQTHPDGEHIITVTRVARDQSWADIVVTQKHNGAHWSKRAALRDGRFRFAVERVTR